MSTHITGLTRDNVRALKELGEAGKDDATLGATTATWDHGPAEVLAYITTAMATLPTKGHPRASLHAVVRKVRKLADAEQAKAIEAANEAGEPFGIEQADPDAPFRPEPDGEFQVMRGYGYDDELFRVIEYRPITAPPEKIQELYHLPELPLEAVEAWHLERHAGAWVGVQRHSFPTAIMVPVGSTAKAYSAVNGGASKPRTRKSGTGRCEHCGEPTKGGRFIPGHDAKLKGDLVREATPEAEAERLIRGWSHDAPSSAKVTKLVAQGDGFLRSRITARTGEDPGGADR